MFGEMSITHEEMKAKMAEIKKLRAEGKLPPIPTLEFLNAQLKNGEITQEEHYKECRKWRLTDKAIADSIAEARKGWRVVF